MSQSDLLIEITVLYALYGIILIAGGATGFKKAKSKVSLISGVASGVISLLIALLSHWILIGSLTMGLILSAALAIVFYARFVQTKKPMPAIPMMVISTLVAIASIVFIVLKRA